MKLEKLKKLKPILKILAWIFILLLILLGLSTRWMLTTWSELTFEEVLFQITTLKGTGTGMISQYIIKSVVPFAIIVALILVVRFAILKNSDKKKYIMPVTAVLGIGLFLFYFIAASRSLGLVAYIKGQLFPSTFIADNYANPDTTTVEFPEKKRNLVYIYMESGEVTFADKENGGYFDTNVIPELTKLAQDNEDFSGPEAALNGGVSLYGTTWTMGGIFAQTAGLPLRTGMDKNGMSTMESFFPDLVTIGNILENNGYKQVYMIGSPAVFGGRDLYFTEHGNFEIQDYYYMQDKGKIDQDYYVFWGYEDQKLFDFAKEELLTLSQSEDPFNLTLLTVDTHFEDGYVCEKCGNTYPDQYSNVFACSSKQITEFVDWIKQQDFYENTTIVISGDHPTMDLDYCQDVDDSYQRKVYTAYINAAAEPEKNERREYSTFDNFPTTLAALGCDIEGNRLGLGTNLFSSEETLLEKYGITSLNTYLQQKSEFLNELTSSEKTDYKENKTTHKATVNVTRSGPDTLDVEVGGITNVGQGIQKVELLVKPVGAEEDTIYEMVYDGFSKYKATIDTSELPDDYGRIKIRATKMSGDLATVFNMNTDIYLISSTYTDYLKKLKEYQDSGRDISILVVGQSDATKNILAPQKEAMNALGFTTDYGALEKQSYYGIIDQNNIVEKVSRSYLTYKGKFKDGTSYKVNSGGFFAGRICHLIVDETEYAWGFHGFNYLVYDNTNNRVISATAYDTYSGDPDCDLEMIEYDETNKILKVKVSKIKGVAKWDRSDNTNLQYFDPDDQSTMIKTKMELNTEEHTYYADLDLSGLKDDRIQMQLLCKGSGARVSISESITSLEFFKYSDVSEYLEYLSKRDDLAVLIAVKNTDLHKLDDSAKAKLKALGLSTVDSFADANKCGYAAVIDNGRVAFEELQNTPQDDRIETSGKLSNGVSYSIESAGLNSGNVSSICIDGTDYSLNRRGVNVVLYDLKKGMVVDTAVINSTGYYMVSR